MKPTSYWIPIEQYDEATHGVGLFACLMRTGPAFVQSGPLNYHKTVSHFIPLPDKPTQETPVDRYIREKGIAESFQPLVREIWATALKEGK